MEFHNAWSQALLDEYKGHNGSLWDFAEMFCMGREM